MNLKLLFEVILLNFILISNFGCNYESDNCSFISNISQDFKQVMIYDFFSYYPLKFGDKSFIDSIDVFIGKPIFKNNKPSHKFIFSTCDEAMFQAEQDFENRTSSIIQMNGITGNFPYLNDVYTELLGIYIENTGCYSHAFTSCYNNKTWSLIDEYYNRNVRSTLKIIDSLNRYLVINSETNETVVAEHMPEMINFEPGTSISLLNDSILCRFEYILLGRFDILIRKDGSAEILEYIDGNLDCDCVGKMKNYFENTNWKPATSNGDTLNSIVEIQFMS